MQKQHITAIGAAALILGAVAIGIYTPIGAITQRVMRGTGPTGVERIPTNTNTAAESASSDIVAMADTAPVVAADLSFTQEDSTAEVTRPVTSQTTTTTQQTTSEATSASDDARGSEALVITEVPPSTTRQVTSGTVVASDDVRGSDAVVINEAAGLSSEYQRPEVRRIAGGTPAQIAAVDAPRSATEVAAAYGVTLTENDRVRARELYARVVPARLALSAKASTRDAVEAFISVGPAGVQKDDPCVTVGAGQRAALMDAFTRTQNALPADQIDYQFACALVTDPENAIDTTKRFPDHRRIDLEPYAIKNFVAFFGRLPSMDAKGNKLAAQAVEQDWWAVKYMTYFPILMSSKRDLEAEAT
ncbi:MAG: hypothetical protein ABIG71_00745, partial [Candidatus Uhrbacteria bacterium]